MSTRGLTLQYCDERLDQLRQALAEAEHPEQRDAIRDNIDEVLDIRNELTDLEAFTAAA